ncbi:MAG: hypothetical protein QXE51_06355 [Nitrososphaeria archaeon]
MKTIVKEERMINLTLFKPEDLINSRINSNRYLRQLLDCWLASWKDLWDLIQDFNQIANEISYMNSSEKNRFARAFKEFLKLKFAEANVFLDRKGSSNVSTLPRFKEDSPAHLLASLTLFYCYLCGVEKLPWMFGELETARLINFVFYYDRIENIVDILRTSKIFRNYKLNLDDYLDPNEIVKHIEQKVISLILRGVHVYEGLLRIYFLFLKDNKKLEQCFLNRVKMELLYKEIGDYRRKELIEVLNKLPFAVEKLLVPLIEDDEILEKAKKALWDNILKFNKKCVERFKEEFKGYFACAPMLDLYLDKRLNLDKRCGIQAFDLQLEERKLRSKLRVKHLKARLIEEIKNIGKWLIKQESLERESKISSVLFSKIIEILYLEKLEFEVGRNFYITTVPDLIETARRIYGDLPVIDEQSFLTSLTRKCFECFSELIINFNKFLEGKEKVLRGIKNLKIEDKQKVLEEFRDVVNIVIKKGIGNSEAFSDEVYKKEVGYWEGLRSSKAKTIAKAINKGKYEKLGRLLNKNLYSMKPVARVSSFTEVDQNLLLLLYYHYLLRYVKEKQDKRAYEVIREVLRENLSIWGYAYLFDDYLDDLEFLRKLKWLSFMLSFWYDFGGARLNTDFIVNSREEEHKEPILYLTYYITEFRSFLAFLIFPDADYEDGFHSGSIDIFVRSEDIFKFLY